jgi:hypothetical protein
MGEGVVGPVGPADSSGAAGSSGAPPEVPTPSLRSISCPRCAGPLNALDGVRLLSCGHCGTPFLISAPGGYSRRYFPCKVERLQAVGRASAWLDTRPDVPKDIEAAVFTDAHLLYLPIWEVGATVVGWEFGKRVRLRQRLVQVGDQEVLQQEMVDEAVADPTLGERRFYQEAADLAALGMGRPHIAGREFTLPYLVGELEPGAAILETDGALAEVQRRATESFRRPPGGATIRDLHLFLLQQTSSLIYYPVWSLRYRYRGRRYAMTVDGRSGVVHSARAPADNSRRLVGLVAACVLLAVALAAYRWAWDALRAVSDPVTAGVLVVILASAASSFWRFRLVREVEYHEPFSA